MAHRALAHKSTDDVAVAVADLQAGEELTIQSLEGGKAHPIKLLHDVALGHKVALKDLSEGHVVIEYGEKVGRMTKAVKKGGYVHVHNIRTLRWDYGKAGGGKREAKSQKIKSPSPTGRGVAQRVGERAKKGGK